MSIENTLVKGKHLLVIGGTGSGKTYFTASLLKKYENCYIFVNPQLEEIVEKITTIKTHSSEEVIDALIEGHRKIEYIPPENVKDAISDLEDIRRALFKISTQIETKERFWITIVIDEAQMYAWKGSKNDLDNFFTRGRRYKIRSIALTQRPQNLSSTIINNITHQIIFKTGGYESVYFKNYKIPIEEHQEWLLRDYHYIIYDGYFVRRCYPISFYSQKY